MRQILLYCSLWIVFLLCVISNLDFKNSYKMKHKDVCLMFWGENQVKFQIVQKLADVCENIFLLLTQITNSIRQVCRACFEQ